MYDELTHDAKNRLSGLEREAADEFESRLLRDRIHTFLSEDRDLRQLLDVTERAYDLDEHGAQPGFIQTAGFEAAERLNDEVEALVDVAIVRILAEFIEDAREGWFDDPESNTAESEVETAFHEVCAWMRLHEDACERAGVDSKGLVWSENGVTEVDTDA